MLAEYDEMFSSFDVEAQLHQKAINASCACHPPFSFLISVVVHHCGVGLPCLAFEYVPPGAVIKHCIGIRTTSCIEILTTLHEAASEYIQLH